MPVVNQTFVGEGVSVPIGEIRSATIRRTALWTFCQVCEWLCALVLIAGLVRRAGQPLTAEFYIGAAVWICIGLGFQVARRTHGVRLVLATNQQVLAVKLSEGRAKTAFGEIDAALKAGVSPSPAQRQVAPPSVPVPPTVQTDSPAPATSAPSTTAKFCPSCGSPTPPANFCARCGQTLRLSQ